MKIEAAQRLLGFIERRIVSLAKQYSQMLNEIGVFRGMHGRRPQTKRRRGSYA